MKSEKRLTDRKTSIWNKKQEDKTKETNNSKEVPGKKERDLQKIPVKKEIKPPVKGKVPINRN